jgi:hypothetical protein
MPRFDGTGPMGQGPRTGYRIGNCGCGMGNRQGPCRRFYGKKEEAEMLKEEEAILESDLKVIKERLSEIKD